MTLRKKKIITYRKNGYRENIQIVTGELYFENTEN